MSNEFNTIILVLIGTGIQNFPEGAAISFPLKNEGMLVEHDLGRLYIRDLVNALECVKSGDKEAKLDVIANAISYTHLLTRHIDKEDRVIYKFAERNLSDEVMRFVDIECENFEISNEDIKNKYVLILEELEKKY